MAELPAVEPGSNARRYAGVSIVIRPHRHERAARWLVFPASHVCTRRLLAWKYHCSWLAYRVELAPKAEAEKVADVDAPFGMHYDHTLLV